MAKLTKKAIREALKDKNAWVYLDHWEHYDGGIDRDADHKGGIPMKEAVAYLHDYPDMGYVVSINTGGFTGVNAVVVNARDPDGALETAYEWYVSYYYEGLDDTAPDGEGPLRVEQIDLTKKAANPKKGKRKKKGKGKRRKNHGANLADVDDKDISEALQRPGSFGYSGDLPLFTTWSLGPVVDQRDATILAKANWEALKRELKEHPEWEHDWEVTGSSHWAVGWVDHLSFKVLDDKGEPTEIFRFLKGWFDALSNYPVASESILSEMEVEAYSEQLERDLRDLESSKLREDLPSDWEEKFHARLRDVDTGWEYAEDGTPYTDEATLESVARDLGYLDEELAENPEPALPYLIFRDLGLAEQHRLHLR